MLLQLQRPSTLQKGRHCRHLHQLEFLALSRVESSCLPSVPYTSGVFLLRHSSAISLVLCSHDRRTRPSHRHGHTARYLGTLARYTNTSTSPLFPPPPLLPQLGIAATTSNEHPPLQPFNNPLPPNPRPPPPPASSLLGKTNPPSPPLKPVLGSRSLGGVE
jgi:hypothetical protein